MSGGQDCMCGPDECTCYPPVFKDSKPLVRKFFIKGLNIEFSVEAVYQVADDEKYKTAVADLIYRLLDRD